MLLHLPLVTVRRLCHATLFINFLIFQVLIRLMAPGFHAFCMTERFSTGVMPGASNISRINGLRGSSSGLFKARMKHAVDLSLTVRRCRPLLRRYETNPANGRSNAAFGL
jgi:hypothetical protein